MGTLLKICSLRISKFLAALQVLPKILPSEIKIIKQYFSAPKIYRTKEIKSLPWKANILSPEELF